MTKEIVKNAQFDTLIGKTIKSAEVSEYGMKILFTDGTFAVLNGGNGANHLPEVSLNWNIDFEGI